MTGFSANAAGIVPSTSGGSAGGTGTVTPSTVQGGALTGTYTRSSTISAPILRDVVSLNDAAWSAVGDGAHDDSTAVNAAVSALQAKGGGTLIMPGLNPAGTQATWTFQRVLIAATSNITISAYGAQMQCVTVSQGSSLFKGDGNNTNPGTYITSGFKLLGGKVLGRTTEDQNQAVVQLDRSIDCTVRDVFVQNWGLVGNGNGGGAVFMFENSSRFQVLNNTCINCCGGLGAQNVIHAQVASAFNGNTVKLQDGLITGNIVHGTPAAAIAVSYGTPAASAQLEFLISGTPTGGATQIQFTLGGVTYTSATLPFNATAAQVQTAIQAATGGVFPASGVQCYGGPAGGAAPFTPILIVFQANTQGLVTNLATIDAFTGGTAPTSLLNYPAVRIAIRGNDVESIGWSAIVLEQGGNPTTSSCPIIDVQITGNVCRYSGPVQNGKFGIDIEHTGGVSLDYAFLFRLILISNNLIHSNAVGIQSQASDVTIGHNAITAYACGITLQTANGQSGVNYVSNISIKGGSIHMADSILSGSAAVSLIGVQDASVDTEIYWDTGATADCDGIQVINGTRIDLSCRIRNAPLRGIRLTGNIGEIRVSSGTRILNPSSETATTTSGIRVEGTLTDNCWIEGGVSVRDTRGGGAAMSYAVDTSAATLGSFGVYLQGSQRFVGWTTGALNGTFASKGDNSIWDTTGVRFTQGKRVTYGTAAPGSGTWGQGDLCWNQTPTSAGQAFWMCTTGGTPGTWTGMNFVASGSTQTGLLRKGISYAMSASDLGVIATASGITITLPTNYSAANVTQSVVVKNASNGSITVSTGSTGKIDNGITGGANAITQTIAASPTANVYVPDTNVGSANYDWIQT